MFLAINSKRCKYTKTQTKVSIRTKAGSLASISSYIVTDQEKYFEITFSTNLLSGNGLIAKHESVKCATGKGNIGASLCGRFLQYIVSGMLIAETKGASISLLIRTGLFIPCFQQSLEITVLL